jgi:hypothetical protein
LLLEAASKNDLDLLRRLIAQNVSVNAVDYDRRSAPDPEIPDYKMLIRAGNVV